MHRAALRVRSLSLRTPTFSLSRRSFSGKAKNDDDEFPLDDEMLAQLSKLNGQIDQFDSSYSRYIRKMQVILTAEPRILARDKFYLEELEAQAIKADADPDYIDTETAKVDKMLAEQKKLLFLQLKEYTAKAKADLESQNNEQEQRAQRLQEARSTNES